MIGMTHSEGIPIAWRRVDLVIWGTRLKFWKVWVDRLLFPHCLVFCPLLQHLNLNVPQVPLCLDASIGKLFLTRDTGPPRCQ